MKLLHKRAAPATPPPAPLGGEARRGLWAPLVLGCLALVAALCLPAPQYMGLQSSADAPPQARVLPVPVRELEQRGRLAEGVDPEQAMATQRRIAANLLLQSGYLLEASVQEDPATNRPLYTMVLRPEVGECASPPMETAGAGQAGGPPPMQADEARLLAIAAVAVEKFHRSALQRRAEWLYAQAMLAATGRLPDLSLGPAQIRPSTVRRLLGSGAPVDASWQRLATDDRAMASALMDECRSLGLAAAVLQRAACSGCDDPAGHALRSYAGQRRQTGAVVDYAPVVQAMALMLQ